MSEDYTTPAYAGCAALSQAIGEPLAGTAPVATAWLAIEQPGPWGRKALTESRLDSEVAAKLAAAAKPAGVKIVLIRRPGRPATAPTDGVLAFTAWTGPRNSWWQRHRVECAEDLLELGFSGLGAGELLPGAGVETGAVALVCGNSKRDACCAIAGRQLAALLSGAGVETWESSHLGGHRFAPTAVVLPTGYAYGRLDFAAGIDAVAAAAAGRVRLDRSRGRSCFGRPAQVADLAVRAATGETEAAAIVESTETDEDSVQVTHRDGRRWIVPVRRESAPETYADPCSGKTIRPAALLAGEPDLLASAVR